MGIIFLIGAVQAFFFISLILNKKNKQTADFVLLVWLFAMGMHLLSYYALYEEKFDSFILAGTMLLLPPLIYAHGPLLYIYTLILSQKSRVFQTKYLLHFIPFIVSLCYYLYLVIFYAEGDLSYFTKKPVVSQYISIVFYLLNIFLNPVYVVIVLVKLAGHQKKIRENFSYLENINLNWLKLLAIGLGSVSIIVWIVHVLTNLNIVSIDFDRDFYIFASIAVFVFVAGFFGFKQGVIYKFTAEPSKEKTAKPFENRNPNNNSENVQQSETKKYEKSQLTDDEVKAIINKLNQYMENDKPFKQNNLGLLDVASTIKVPSHTLSQILNVYLQKNFYNYVNAYRVDEVKKMLIDSKYAHYSLLGIALEAGFNSKSAFNRIFKNVTKQTPTQYKNSQ